jgi:hypothetical protein
MRRRGRVHRFYVARLGGFNASHSMGAILFGLMFGVLALAHAQILFQSNFLLSVGLAFLGGYFALGKVYWFSVPFAGISVSPAILGLYSKCLPRVRLRRSGDSSVTRACHKNFEADRNSLD